MLMDSRMSSSSEHSDSDSVMVPAFLSKMSWIMSSSIFLPSWSLTSLRLLRWRNSSAVESDFMSITFFWDSGSLWDRAVFRKDCIHERCREPSPLRLSIFIVFIVFLNVLTCFILDQFIYVHLYTR